MKNQCQVVVFSHSSTSTRMSSTSKAYPRRLVYEMSARPPGKMKTQGLSIHDPPYHGSSRRVYDEVWDLLGPVGRRYLGIRRYGDRMVMDKPILRLITIDDEDIRKRSAGISHSTKENLIWWQRTETKKDAEGGPKNIILHKFCIKQRRRKSPLLSVWR